MNSSASSPAPPAADSIAHTEPLAGTVLLTAGIMATGDFLLWHRSVGVGLALFIMILAVAIVAKGRRSWRTWLAFGLLIATCVQSMIDLCLTNGCMLVVLFAVLAGEAHFSVLPAGLARWFEGLLAWLRTPGRWIWLLGEASDTRRWQHGGIAGAGPSIARTFTIAAPALLLFGLFSLVLANGNAVLRDSFTSFGQHLAHWLQQFDFSPLRIMLWGLLGMLALTAMRSPAAPEKQRALTHPPRTWLRADPAVGFWQSVCVLGALNLLFCVVNTIDATFLWMHRAIPVGVDPYEFIHEGTNSLITATVLSAIVLSAIFHQTPEISRRRALRVLAHVWVAQNLVLLASIGLRLWLYVDFAHLLTAKRIHLGCFLGLVALGFFFLLLHIERGPDLRRLLWRNALASFVLLFTIQFVNTTGISAAWNVTRCLTVPGWGIDLAYLDRQGFDAWPALSRLAAAPSSVDEVKIPQARALLQKRAAEARTMIAQLDWRERQFRRDAYAAQLIAASEASPAP